MILFRQKSFSKKKIIEDIVRDKKALIEFFDKYKGIIGATGTVGGLGLGGINLRVNLKRTGNESDFQQQQLDATKELTKAIQELSDEESKNKIKQNKRLFRKSQKPYTSDYYLPKPIENIKGSVEESIKSKKKKKKT